MPDADAQTGSTPTPADEQTLVEALLSAYHSGWFPMADIGGPVRWYDPDPRGILPIEPGGFHVSRSLRRTLRRGVFDLKTDSRFEAVIRACAEPRGEGGEWIDERIIHAYTMLHRAGHAHSVEAWRDGRLVGGLYGVRLGGAFFAESMFSRPEIGGTDASKACLAALVCHLRRRGFLLLDVQMWSPHLARFGCEEVSRADFKRRLTRALRIDPGWGGPADWRPDTAGSMGGD